MWELITKTVPPIHREGHFFIFLFLIITLLLYLINSALGLIGTVLTLFCIFFFRDPVRVTPVNDNLIISPADGVIQNIVQTLPPKELTNMPQEEMTRISIFLNIFNVHVNRVPASGRITNSIYHPGKFLNASLDKASEDNERQTISMRTTQGEKEIAFVQIAGLIARRIVCDIREGQEIRAGERFGIIRFGSRVDLYLPLDIVPQVVVGQTVIGGETILAQIEGDINIREGEIR
jgi:phosphatidylserine decarboxylase